MANEKQLAILKQGGAIWNSWRRENPQVEIDLSDANLHGANLMANIYGRSSFFIHPVNISSSDLRRADITNAHLAHRRIPV
jgi:uncharacterized protein YjbI with pentapeptide repeats